MADDLQIKDGAGLSKKLRTTDRGGDTHVPHHVIADGTGSPYGANNPVPVSPNTSRGSGAVDANTTRVVLASDGPAVSALANIDSDIGALNATAAPADGSGDYSVIAALKRGLLNWATLLARIPSLVGGRVPVTTTPAFAPSGVTAISNTFTGAGRSAPFVPVPGRNFNIVISGGFIATVRLEASFDGGATHVPVTDYSGDALLSFTTPSFVKWSEDEAGVSYTLNCTSFTSGTVNYRISQ